ncbi:hypothetical protein [Actinokineospora enzanensis]|uniref:hypothetical protein n=1 Tax=Actinokineospora enzanensis TaxID=155975 RepID=UPI00036B3494|nr:hypothetical protein [Actinokineospora enzanensis]
MIGFAGCGRPEPPPVPPAVHRAILVVDVESFGDHGRTNADRWVVRDALFRLVAAALAGVGIDWSGCDHEGTGDGVIVLVPAEVAKSALVERLPDGLATLLRAHNKTHAHSERIRLRMAVHAGEVNFDAHGVVGDAVNHACRLVDCEELRQSLSASSGALALIASNWFYTEVIRHSPRIDPAGYHPVRVRAKETDTTGWIRLPDLDSGSAPVPHARGTAPDPDRSLWTAAAESVKRLGARRTAYPLDLSIAELHAQGLYVAAGFTKLTGKQTAVSVDRLVEEIETGSSLLILGEPGSGKSVAAYALLRALWRRVPAIAVRVSDLAAATHPWLSRPDGGPRPGPRPVLVVDGLDEAQGDLVSATELSDLLHRFHRDFVIVVTCRRRDYEDDLAHTLETGLFDAIYAVDAWTPEDQFAEFVDRLVDVGMLDSRALVDVVAASPDMAGLVARPLYARMLTFLGAGGSPAVTSVLSLYAEYIDRLAAVSDAMLTRFRNPLPAAGIWAEAAWTIFSRGWLREDRFDFDAVTAEVAARIGGSPSGVARALSQICDQRRSGGRVWGTFVHYSFFEYLVGHCYARVLRRTAAGGDTTELMACLRVDPTPEIRHFVVDDLVAARAPDLVDVLTRAYAVLSTADLSTRRTAGNLVAYLLSRAAAEPRRALWRLREHETDEFLSQALLWGLCHLGDDTALTEFVERSRASARWRALNRGYLMYYYGDLDRRARPPYVDGEPLMTWNRTRERSVALLSGAGYSAIAAQRRFLDLYSFYDYAIRRGEELAEHDVEVAAAALAALWNGSSIDGELLLELQAMHAVATGGR